MSWRLFRTQHRDVGSIAAATFVDLETGRDLYIDPEMARQQYKRNFTQHADEIGRICNDLGVDIHPLVTSQPLELALFGFLQSRLHGGRQVARSGYRASAGGARGVR